MAAVLRVDEGYQTVSTAPDAPDPDMGSNEYILKSEHRQGDTIAGLAAVGAAALIFLTTAILIITNNPLALSWFSFHAPFNVFALLLLVLAVTQLQPTANPRTKAAGLSRHWLGAAPALLLVVLGTAAMLTNKAVHDAPHFTTWHGLFGIIVLGLLVAQAAFGASTVFFDGKVFGGAAKAKMWWKYHRLSGYIVLPLMLLTVHLGGAWSVWVEMHTAYVVRLIVYTIAPIAVACGLVARIRPSKMNFS
ncbi:hypothetical protein PENSPDRAFT_657660 [Peniophora sp. CONT]|nr:hypothetical protein PENSPDRAFT_657660 [Peniophora sp. CONT]